MGRSIAIALLAAACGCAGDNPCPGELACKNSGCCALAHPYTCGQTCFGSLPTRTQCPQGYYDCVDRNGGNGGGALQAQCTQAGLLYCQSPSIPNGEQCCVISVGNRNASIGYLCAWGANVATGPNCVESLALASDPQQGCILYGHGPPAAIVRCTR